MIALLAFRHLMVRKRRSLFLLFGFALGVGVMIVLLSVGEAMLEQSRDASLVGGGAVTVLPQGIDVEAMRTGGLSGMFFSIDRARLLTRQTLGGERQRHLVRIVSPAIEGKLLYLGRGDRIVAVRAGGDIPSRAAAVGSGLPIIAGRWEDSPADSAYIAPGLQQLYDELDRFHLPSRPDSSWAEWHYFNLVTSRSEWWYITYLVAGGVSSQSMAHGRWGGQLLVTHRQRDGGYERYVAPVRPPQIAFDTTRADVTLGPSYVRQRNGVYRLHGQVPGRAGLVRIDVRVTPAPNRYFPPVELEEDRFLSGYVVPGLAASASGEICVRSHCDKFADVPAYHDHNWGVWRDVTWEWGTGHGGSWSVLYGGVRGPGNASPFFLAMVDSVGVKQVLRFDRVRYQGARSTAGSPRTNSPSAFEIQAGRESDSVRLHVGVVDALATGVNAGAYRRVFLQMRGRFRLSGRVAGEIVADSGAGFFETYISPP